MQWKPTPTTTRIAMLATMGYITPEAFLTKFSCMSHYCPNVLLQRNK